MAEEATESRARPYCETDWFYKAPDYTAFRELTYYPPNNQAFNEGKVGFYAVHNDGSEREISEKQAQEYVDIAKKAFAKFMGK